jgi:hypothetical protein
LESYPSYDTSGANVTSTLVPPTFAIARVTRHTLKSMATNVKVKQSHYMPWRYLGGEEDNSSFLSLALDGG